MKKPSISRPFIVKADIVLTVSAFGLLESNQSTFGFQPDIGIGDIDSWI